MQNRVRQQTLLERPVAYIEECVGVERENPLEWLRGAYMAVKSLLRSAVSDPQD